MPGYSKTIHTHQKISYHNLDKSQMEMHDLRANLLPLFVWLDSASDGEEMGMVKERRVVVGVVAAVDQS